MVIKLRHRAVAGTHNFSAPASFDRVWLRVREARTLALALARTLPQPLPEP